MSDKRLPTNQPIGNQEMVKTVLVVDDNDHVANLLVYALEGEGYQVVRVRNGLLALDKLRWGLRPWCLLLDMRMPVMTGWELRKEMDADPDLRDIPVIGMTGGRWRPEDTVGFAALLEKPIDLEQLQGLLKSLGNLRISSSARRSGEGVIRDAP